MCIIIGDHYYGKTIITMTVHQIINSILCQNVMINRFSDQQYLLIVQYTIEKRQIEKEQFLKCAYNNDIRDS